MARILKYNFLDLSTLVLSSCLPRVYQRRMRFRTLWIQLLKRSVQPNAQSSQGEVLRQVWNLSDEDGDSGLPTSIHLDEPPTPVRKVFAPEVLGSGESSWRLPQGSMY